MDFTKLLRARGFLLLRTAGDGHRAFVFRMSARRFKIGVKSEEEDRVKVMQSTCSETPCDTLSFFQSFSILNSQSSGLDVPDPPWKRRGSRERVHDQRPCDALLRR